MSSQVRACNSVRLEVRGQPGVVSSHLPSHGFQGIKFRSPGLAVLPATPSQGPTSCFPAFLKYRKYPHPTPRQGTERPKEGSSAARQSHEFIGVAYRSVGGAGSCIATRSCPSLGDDSGTLPIWSWGKQAVGVTGWDGLNAYPPSPPLHPSNRDHHITVWIISLS